MGKKNWRKRLRKAMAAGFVGVSLAFLPAAPVAEASILADVIGGIIGIILGITGGMLIGWIAKTVVSEFY